MPTTLQMLKVQNPHPLAAVVTAVLAAAAAVVTVRAIMITMPLHEELEGQDMERTRQVYTACLELLPLSSTVERPDQS